MGSKSNRVVLVGALNPYSAYNWLHLKGLAGIKFSTCTSFVILPWAVGLKVILDLPAGTPGVTE